MTGTEYVSGSITLRDYGPLLRVSSEELFTPFGPPSVFCTGSGQGKTVAAVDAWVCNRERASGLFYVCNSYDDPRNQYLQSMVDDIHVKNFSMEFLSFLWGEILQRSVEAGRALNDINVREFVQHRCASHPSYAMEIGRIRTVIAANRGMFTNASDLDSAAKVLERDVMVDFIGKQFDAGDPSLAKPEAELVAWCQSSTPLPIVIFDDITAQLKTPPSGKFDVPSMGEAKVVYSNMSGANALNYLLISILTTMRRNGVCAFFVHELSTFEPGVRQNCGAVVMDERAVQEIQRLHTTNEQDKALIAAAWYEIRDFPFHRLVYFSDPSTTPHGQRVAVFKATFHTQKLPIGVPTFVRVMDAVKRDIAAYRAAKRQSAINEAQETQRSNVLTAIANAPPSTNVGGGVGGGMVSQSSSPFVEALQRNMNSGVRPGSVSGNGTTTGVTAVKPLNPWAALA